MKREEILEAIAELARSQGYYGRMYRYLLEVKERDINLYELFMSTLEEKNFNDVVDFILYVEG